MGRRISLFYETYTEPKLTELIPQYEIVRLKGLVRFMGRSGFSVPYRAIIDTGAHMCIVPRHIWEDAKVERLGSYEVSGLSTKPECKIPTLIGKVWLLLQDRYGNETNIGEVHACLALTDDVPLIVGFKDLLSRFKVFFDHEARDAYIETRTKT